MYIWDIRRFDMQSKEIEIKRQIVAKFDPGEDLMEALEACVKKHNIRSGFMQFIGGLDKITYGVYNIEKKGYEMNERAGFHELMGIGNISVKSDGTVFAHVHFFTNNKRCEPCGGHLVKGCRIFPFAEVLIQETESEITRVYDESTNLWPIDLHLA